MSDFTKPELLAPAGDKQSFYTAVNNGADAVYLGLGNFNARMKAENFDNETLKECVRFAHFFGVKVYITLNTLIADDEMLDMVRCVKQALEAGVDAFIVQDLGVIYVLKQCFPNIILHLSTQAGVHNVEGAKIAEALGVKRVVLSRETKLEDIKAIKSATNLELEYFVQGALCVCFSGNCYLSSKEFGASGNRGLCKQLCRLPYTYLCNGKTQTAYMLSAKDLCLLDSVKELQEAGICSFKIEGRMRREGYVGQAVKIYRQAIDYGFDKKGLSDAHRNLEIAFNRQFLSRAYLDDGVGQIINKNTANHIGMEIGKVICVKPFKNLNSIIIKSKISLNKGDGLKFFENGVEKTSLGIGSVEKIDNEIFELISTARVKEGWTVNIILQAQKEQELKNAKRYCDIEVIVEAYQGKSLSVTAFGGGVRCSISSKNILEKSVNSPISETQFENNFKKVADSGFKLSNFTVLTEGVFLPVSELNAIRRALYDELKEKIIDKNSSIKVETSLAETKMKELQNEYLNKNNLVCNNQNLKNSDSLGGSIKNAQILHYLYPWDKAVEITNCDETVVLCPAEYNSKGINALLEKIKEFKGEVALLLPCLANGKDISIIRELLCNYKNKINSLVADNLFGLMFATEKYKVYAGAGLNAYNSFCVKQLIELGAYSIQPSAEINGNEICGNLANTKNYNLPLMTLAHCPFKTLNGNDCKTCSYSGSLYLTDDKRKYRIERYRLSQCYFKIFQI